ncbi:hypothetical protein [uncultured Aquimarina sp.]|uniref:hypothetical protein n=1 Tax=uncultured Aquimarina sp. TaxID=575652 RepID=UPI00261BF794|nr:hypothetical protein [uncultured Aquimarina sp.]
MKKMINSIPGAQKLSKSSQKEIQGGMPGLSDCVRGCYRFYLVDIDGVNCAVPSPSGAVCFGTVRNNQCCI